jgi:hypothetical protein
LPVIYLLGAKPNEQGHSLFRSACLEPEGILTGYDTSEVSVVDPHKIIYGIQAASQALSFVAL